MADFKDALTLIKSRRAQLPVNKSLLVRINSIDPSAKGKIAKDIVADLQKNGINAAYINIDPWLNLPAIRFNQNSLAETFYHKALRFDDVFRQLINPLKHNRSLTLTAELTREPENDLIM